MADHHPLTGYVARLLLGRWLRRLREQRNLHSEDAAARAGVAQATLWRMERGDVRWRCTSAEVGVLAGVYGTDEDGAKPLLELAEAARRPSWVSAFRSMLPEVVEAYIELEGCASRIRCYASAVMPELLWSEEYAKAVFAASGKLSDIEICTHTNILLNRQAILRERAVQLEFVIDEAVLHRYREGAGVEWGQLAGLPNVTIQVVPFREGIYPELDGGSFVILEFAGDEQYGRLPTTVGVSRLGERVLLDEPADVEAYERSWCGVREVGGRSVGLAGGVAG